MKNPFRNLRRRRRRMRWWLLKCYAIQLDRWRRNFRKNLLSPSSDYTNIIIQIYKYQVPANR
jgi:hypothetical protein